jgi:cobalamin-dependent methionine synthase I
MSCRESSKEVDALLDRALLLCESKLSYKVCFAQYEIKIDSISCDLGFVRTDSRDLSRCLSGCEHILVFAATVGLELDRLILRYGKSEPSLAVALQAIGTERVEAICDAFYSEMKEKYAREGKALRPRFSAGYGDLALSLQKNVFSALGCECRIGLTLNDSLIMSPSKSVTAIIGIY